MRRLFFISILVFAFSGLKAQFLGDDIMGDKDKIDIPFVYNQGFIIVKVRFGNMLRLNLLFDTGAEHSVVFDEYIASILKLEYDQIIKVYGADLGHPIFAYIARQVKVNATNTKTVKRDLLVIQNDSLFMDRITGIPIDGILGNNFFRGLKVKINFKRKKITLYKRDVIPKGLDKYETLPLEFRRFKPYLRTDLVTQEGLKMNLNLLLDTGAVLGLMLHSNTNEFINVPDNAIRGFIGKGLGGNIEGFLGKVRSVDIGNNTLHNLIGNYQDVDTTLIDPKTVFRDGLIGNTILSRFEFIIDYVNSNLHIKPNSNFKKKFHYDKSGLSIYAYGSNLKSFIVQHVYQNSPAFLAGMKKGDIITKIGWRYTRNMSLERLNHRLEGKRGKTMKIKVLRGEEELKFQFKLRNWFDDHFKSELEKKMMAEMDYMRGVISQSLKTLFCHYCID